VDANVRPLREQARTWAGSRCRPQPRTARTAKPGESDRRGRHILGRCEKLSLGFRLEDTGHGRRVTVHFHFQSVLLADSTVSTHSSFPFWLAGEVAGRRACPPTVQAPTARVSFDPGRDATPGAGGRLWGRYPYRGLWEELLHHGSSYGV